MNESAGMMFLYILDLIPIIFPRARAYNYMYSDLALRYANAGEW